ncbi:translation termination factor GTPase eRF3 [Vanrija albida]|uniref:Eukaryotic peptide chain release factor GTP-binding subunit n=1 Tax=Vanrija albida TaxID=181172 RepID=A0ABR3PYW4_9TREE
MSGQPPFNPGAFEFRPGQSFVPRGQQQQQQGQQQGQDQYGQYGGQPYGGQQGYPQYGGQYGGHQQYGGYQGYQQQQGGYQGYPQQGGAPQQRAYQPQQRSVQGFQPPSFGDAPKPAPSLSIGGGAPKPAPSLSIGGGAPKPAPSLSIGGAKPAPSLNIGGGAPKAAPSLSIGGAKPAPSLSIGGGAPKAAPSLSIGGGAPKAAPSLSIGKKAEPKAAEPKAAPKEEAAPKAPAPKDEAPKVEEKAATPAPAPAAPSPAVSTPAATSGTSTPNFSKVSAKNDAEAVAREQEAAGADALRDLYGGDVVDPNVKQHLNIIFTGHVDAGKSTCGGQLMYLTGAVDKRTMEKYEQEAKAAGRETWYLSWALDQNKEERAKGKTIEVGRAYFETDIRRYTILDAPGHKTFVPNMIQGAAQADVALLVLSARKGEFETGFERDGQTREHAMLIKNNGINKLIVLVNKMDDTTVQWDKGRYDEICNKITPFLKGIGFNPKNDLTFIPVSAQMGQNMKDRIDKKTAPWYEGPSLLEFLDSMKILDRDINAPFMLPVSEKYNELGTMVMGKVESGRVKKGDSLLLMPNKVSVEVAAIYTETAEEMDQAFCGDNIRIRLRGLTDDDVQPGYVLTSPSKPVHAVTSFKADLSIIETKNIICGGYSCILHVHTLSEEVTLTALLHYYDKKTKRKSRKPPQFAKVGMLVSVIIETSAPICIERWEDYKMLGRFSLRDEGRTVAIGKVTKLLTGAGGDEIPDVGKLSVKA